ncbi:MAG: 30S ribosomal protein S16 [Candidatus Omnitrophica bacterium]|nr:30S ribosomal protein S16 [Candidatus Omnitrophota bacterium]MBU4589717.1 30S ribosomal protein S16 [Candidatus Omnitrophota bacterium]
MAVRIRLKRFGTKKKPHRRIVVCDKRRSRDGKTIEEIGHYDPSKTPPVIVVDNDRAKYWISNGAVPSEIVRSLLKKQGVL